MALHQHLSLYQRTLVSAPAFGSQIVGALTVQSCEEAAQEQHQQTLFTAHAQQVMQNCQPRSLSRVEILSNYKCSHIIHNDVATFVARYLSVALTTQQLLHTEVWWQQQSCLGDSAGSYNVSQAWPLTSQCNGCMHYCSCLRTTLRTTLEVKVISLSAHASGCRQQRTYVFTSSSGTG